MNENVPEDRVRPLPPDPEDPAGRVVPVQATTEAKGPKRAWIVGGAILGVIIVVAIASVTMYRNVVGDAFASTRAVPRGAQVVVTFDLLQVRDTSDIQALVDAFTAPLAATGEIDAGFDIVEEIDGAWEDELGITLSDDVVPWLGRSASVAVWPDGSSFVETEDVQVLVSLAVRDAGGAESFVTKVLAVAVDQEGGTVETGSIDGRPVWSYYPDDEWSDPIHVMLDEDLLLAAPEERTLRSALTASESGGLGSDAAFRNAVDRLPADRTVALYVSADALRNVYRDPAFAELGLTSDAVDMLEGWEALAASMTLVDEGVRFDMVQTLEAGVALDDVWSGMAEGDVRYRDRLPAETYGFYAFPIPDDYLADQLALMEEMDPAAFEEIRSLGLDFLGVDVLEDVVPNLGRELVFAAVESTEGLLAAETGFPIGLAVALGVLDPVPVREAVDGLEELAVDEGVPLVVEDGVGVIAEGGETAVAYTVTDEGLIVASSVGLLDQIAEGPGGVTGSSLYQELDAAIPGDGLLFYVDTHRIYDQIEWPDGWRGVADPLRGMGASVAASDGGVAGTFLVLIDY
jgi:hypothetical protein